MAKKQYHPQARLWHKLGPVAKQMRQEPTQAEKVLWEMLRDRRLCGYKFRRQHAIDRFVVDFFCHDASLIIEVDGPIHETQKELDLEREEILTQIGFRVLRFTNDQVIHHLEKVIAEIKSALETPKNSPGN